MNRSARRKEMDSLLADAQDLGLTVEPWTGGKGGAFWRITNPTSGESIRVVSAASGRTLRNERAKIRRLAALPAADAEPAAPPASPPEPEPTPTPEPAPAAPEPAPAALPEQPKEPPVADTAPQSLPAAAHSIWDIIRSEPGLTEQEIEGEPGYLWVGSLNEVMTTLWPSLASDEDSRKLIHRFLTASANMICLQRGSRSKWWVRAEWQTGGGELRGAVAVRKPARSIPAVTRRPAEPVTVSFECPEPDCKFRSASKHGLAAHSRVHAPPKPAPAAPPADNPVAAITALLDRNRELELTVTRLSEENQRLKAEATAAADLQSQLDAVRLALGGTR